MATETLDKHTGIFNQSVTKACLPELIRLNMIWFIPMDRDFVHSVHISLYPSSWAPKGDWLHPMNRDFVHLVHISPYSQNFAHSYLDQCPIVQGGPATNCEEISHINKYVVSMYV